MLQAQVSEVAGSCSKGYRHLGPEDPLSSSLMWLLASLTSSLHGPTWVLCYVGLSIGSLSIPVAQQLASPRGSDQRENPGWKLHSL